MTYSDDDLARELRRELQGSLVPFDPARAQYMIDEAIAASPVRRVLQSRWTLPLLASGAVAAVVGGVAGATTLQSDGKPAHPGGGPTVSVHPSPIPTTPQCLPPRPSTIPFGPAVTLPSAPGSTVVLTLPPSPSPTCDPGGGPTSTTAPSQPPTPPPTVAPSTPAGPPTVSSGPGTPSATVAVGTPSVPFPLPSEPAGPPSSVSPSGR